MIVPEAPGAPPNSGEHMTNGRVLLVGDHPLEIRMVYRILGDAA
jgi:hypothetical protein